MFTSRLLWFLFILKTTAVFGAGPNLGQPIGEAELAPWDISILPDGRGLPSGGGTPAQGAPIYAQKCALCHGEGGKGGVNAALVGGAPVKDMNSVKTIANFWPYASTLFDFIRRAMPYQQPLAANKLIGENDAMNAATLPKVRMPNRDGFIPRFPERM